jgi:hypothetical protein
MSTFEDFLFKKKNEMDQTESYQQTDDIEYQIGERGIPLRHPDLQYFDK